MNRYTRSARPVRGDRTFPHIDHAGTGDAGLAETKHGFVSFIRYDEESRPRTGRNAVAREIGEGGTGEHHARHIVAREGNQPLARAARQNDALDANDAEPFPQTAECLALFGRQRLERSEYPVTVRADDRRPGEATHAIEGSEIADPRLTPLAPARVEEGTAAKYDVAVGQDDSRTVPTESKCGGESRRARADDEHVRMIVNGLCGRGVSVQCRLQSSKAGRTTNCRFEEPLPGPGRRHECLVVETCREKTAEETTHGEHVESKRRPAILAFGDETCFERQRGRGTIRFPAVAADHVDERAGFFRPRCHDAAGPVVFETPPDEPHAIRKQRRCQRVAAKALHRSSVK